MQEISFYMIKPHALVMRAEVVERIEQSGLTIVESKLVALGVAALEIIYADLTPQWRSGVFHQYVDKPVEVGIVKGTNAITALLEVSGRERNPADCLPGTIRFDLGIHEPAMVYGVRVYHNVLHRSRNTDEAEKDVAVFQQL